MSADILDDDIGAEGPCRPIRDPSTPAKVVSLRRERECHCNDNQGRGPCHVAAHRRSEHPDTRSDGTPLSRQERRNVRWLIFFLGIVAGMVVSAVAFAQEKPPVFTPVAGMVLAQYPDADCKKPRFLVTGVETDFVYVRRQDGTETRIPMAYLKRGMYTPDQHNCPAPKE